MPEYQIGALWISGPLSFLEQLCLVSFRDAGHHTILWKYDDVTCVPPGIEVRDANEILPITSTITHEKTGSPAPQADKFRYHMLSQVDRVIWADTDAYCLKPFETSNGHFYGWESEKHINNGVLGLPKDSDTLGELLAFTSDEFAIPPWFDDKRKREYEDAKARGEPVGAGAMSWGVWGPQALTHFLHATGEVKYALPRQALYPFRFKERRFMTRAGFDSTPYITEETRSIHFYGRRMRKRIVEAHGGRPPGSSLIGKLIAKHRVEVDAAPIPVKAAPGAAPVVEPPPPEPPVNPLTRIADALGSDQGSRKHRFTELYHLLLHPYRDRSIRLLGVGQTIDGADPDTPSAAIWLDYLAKAEVLGVDSKQFPTFTNARYTPLTAEFGDTASLFAAAESAGEVDVVIDDATHASPHQQAAFRAFFPKLRPGGLYIIEDLRWQPPGIEPDDAVKTADLFRGFAADRRFRHKNAETEAALNALAGQIAGCFLFQAQFDKSRRDQVAVIQKSEDVTP